MYTVNYFAALLNSTDILHNIELNIIGINKVDSVNVKNINMLPNYFWMLISGTTVELTVEALENVLY